MKVVLIFASITECGFHNDFTIEGTWINHGLASISAYLKQHGYYPELIDLRRLRGWRQFSRIISEKKPSVAGITIMSVDYNPAMKCVHLIKKVSPQTKTVVGGPHPSLILEDFSKEGDIDYIIQKEGEISFKILLDNIKSNIKTERVISGIHPDLDSLPSIDRELFSAPERPILDYFQKPFVSIITGRGCIYNCSFCQPAERIIFGKKVRRRSIKNVIEELLELKKKYQFNTLMIHDDCFTEYPGWILKFCKDYKKKINKPFICQSRVDIICKYPELMKLMKKSGLEMFIIGFESGNQRILNFLRKGTTVEQNYRAVEICQKLGIKIWANCMLGIPTETKEEAMDTVNFIRETKPFHYSPAFFTPHPGSDLFEYCKKHNLSLIKSHDHYRRNINVNAPKIKGIDYDFLNKIVVIEAPGIKKTLAKKYLFKKSRKNTQKIFIKKISNLFYYLRHLPYFYRHYGPRMFFKKIIEKIL